MSLINYINRVSIIDSLIKSKSTGNASQLAKTVQLSEPSLLRHIKTMKASGFPIRFSRKYNSYYYFETNPAPLG
ncbi:MAG: HTH domain-containing protein [Ferruginibacter sp.]